MCVFGGGGQILPAATLILKNFFIVFRTTQWAIHMTVAKVGLLNYCWETILEHAQIINIACFTFVQGAGADFVMMGGMFAGHDQSGKTCKIIVTALRVS